MKSENRRNSTSFVCSRQNYLSNILDWLLKELLGHPDNKELQTLFTCTTVN